MVLSVHRPLSSSFVLDFASINTSKAPFFRTTCAQNSLYLGLSVWELRFMNRRKKTKEEELYAAHVASS